MFLFIAWRFAHYLIEKCPPKSNQVASVQLCKQQLQLQALVWLNELKIPMFVDFLAPNASRCYLHLFEGKRSVGQRVLPFQKTCPTRSVFRFFLDLKSFLQRQGHPCQPWWSLSPSQPWLWCPWWSTGRMAQISDRSMKKPLGQWDLLCCHMIFDILCDTFLIRFHTDMLAYNALKEKGFSEIFGTGCRRSWLRPSLARCTPCCEQWRNES